MLVTRSSQGLTHIRKLPAGVTSFGVGTELPLAIETGGRETRIYAEITVAVAAGVASNRHLKAELDEYNKAVDAYVTACSSNVMVIEHDAHVLNTAKVINVCIGPHAVIDSATWVEDVTVLSSAEETSAILAGSVVKRSVCRGCARGTAGSLLILWTDSAVGV